MGARIEGAGTSEIVVDGVARLNGASHDVLPDRIETGTYAMAVAMAGGDVTLENTRPELLQFAFDVLQEAGTEVTRTPRRRPGPSQRQRNPVRSMSRPTRFRASPPTCRRSSWPS